MFGILFFLIGLEAPMKPTTLKLIFTSLLISLGGTNVAAQTANKQANSALLSGPQLTEEALIDALAVDSSEVSDGAAKTRGFRPVKPGDVSKPVNPNAGKANLQVTFETNSATLTPESRGTLDMLARAMQSDRLAGFSFNVEGHADARGDADSNLKLSQLRAESVANYLVAAQGLLPERLNSVGKGSSEPLNKARVDAPENRRVTIVTVKN
ncbi:OmpA family protein [Roseateles oligotrophus]|uniref:OmpA family protein n=1 Tax=Roseateles oligotrophus TaxID=1769250 RepID=A0ABT2YGB5_9BURK|nr:OmpA family protein [Roseateles oligotrophus]MCV2369040.1 OmpA family protein [Roseateles oligotrophus]